MTRRKLFPRCLLRSREIARFFGWSRAYFRTMWRQGGFPKPINLAPPSFVPAHLPQEERRRMAVEAWRRVARVYYWNGREIAAWIRRKHGDEMAASFLDAFCLESDLEGPGI